MEKSKMTNCKSCGTEIAKSAKSCPHCGAKNKNGHPVLIGLLVFVVLIAIIGAMGSDDEPKKVEGTLPGQTDTAVSAGNDEDGENIFHVGELAELKGVTVALVNVTESEGSDFNKPSDGNVFVLCEFEIVNNSNEEITVSSMLSFDAYCDDYACSYSLSALLEKGNKNQLDATIAAGKKVNGVIGYEVPENWKDLEIHFTPNFWTGKEIVFVASNG